MKTKTLQECRDAQNKTWVRFASAALMGQVIINGLAKIPLLSWAKVTTRDAMKVVTEYTEVYNNKFWRD